MVREMRARKQRGECGVMDIYDLYDFEADRQTVGENITVDEDRKREGAR